MAAAVCTWRGEGGGRREESTVRGMKSADEVGEMSPADEVTDNEISWRIKNMI